MAKYRDLSVMMCVWEGGGEGAHKDWKMRKKKALKEILQTEDIPHLLTLLRG